MRVSDLITSGVVFLAVKDDGRERMAGSAFFVGVPSDAHVDRTYGYLVTARHCVEKAKTYGSLFVRINRRTVSGFRTPEGAKYTSEELAAQVGDAELIEIESGSWPSWVYHEDEENDVAVLPFMPSQNEFNFVITREQESFATDDVIAREAIGIGDDIMVVGLFTSHHGRATNLPIVRGGIIAAMPHEPIQDPNSGSFYDAYLAEVRSVGGLSGSPVWVVINPARVKPGSHQQEYRLHFYLLGLIRGHWKKDDEWLSDFAGGEEESLNTGISIVTPIQKVIDVLHSDELVAQRRKSDLELGETQEGAEPLDASLGESTSRSDS